jgi:hypothetical protein
MKMRDLPKFCCNRIGDTLVQTMIRVLLKEFHLLGLNTVWSFQSQPAFQRNIFPPSLGSQRETRKKPT